MEPKPYRLKNIQALRGLAILLVVLFHLMTIEGKYGLGDRILPDFMNAGAFGVDIFFVISGVVLTLAARAADSRVSELPGFLIRRLRRIFPLYWGYSLIVLVVYLAKPGWVNALEQHQVRLLASFLLLPQDRLPLLAVGWVLIHQIYFYLGFAGLWATRRGNLGVKLAIWAILAAGGALIFSSPGPSFSWSRVAFHPLTLEFIGGCFIGLLIQQGRHRFGAFSLVAGLAAWAGTAFPVFEVFQHSLPTDWARLAWFGLPAWLIVYGAVAVEFGGGFRLPGFLQRLGDVSYSIYLSHVLVLSGLGRLWTRYGLAGREGNLLMLGIMLTAVILWGFTGYYLLEKRLTAWTGAGR